jgi:ubiquitin C-terminal hydrolase
MLKSGDLIVPAINASSNIDDELVYVNRQRRAISNGLEKRGGACFYECIARNIYGIDAKIVMFYAADK